MIRKSGADSEKAEDNFMNRLILYKLLIIVGLLQSCDRKWDNYNDDIHELAEIKINLVSQVRSTSATLRLILKSASNSILEKGICYDTLTLPTINSFKEISLTEDGRFEIEISNLQINTTYYLRAYTINNIGVYYSEEIFFITLDGRPNGIHTNTVNSIQALSAIGGGNVENDGGFEIVSKGLCWSSNSAPTIMDNKTIDGAGLGSFESHLTDLTLNTRYFVRAYATNEKGTTYGPEKYFYTLDGTPEGVQTNEVSVIYANRASCGGNIESDGGFPITAKGICWGINHNPSLSDSYTTDGSGLSMFSSNLTNLDEFKTYYVRAYAANQNGTTYGNEVSFETYEPVFDFDGNKYKVIKINDQVWMAENLKATHYPNGINIPWVTDSVEWSQLLDNNTDDAYCFPNNLANSDYGALYTWAAAMGDNAVSSSSNPSGVQGVCPDGFHLPSYNEWLELEDFISSDGFAGIEGSALKSKDNWEHYNNGTNIYEFNALPEGIRRKTGEFYNNGSIAQWWSSTYDYYDYIAVLAPLLTDYSTHFLTNYGIAMKESSGLSVRCIRD